MKLVGWGQLADDAPYQKKEKMKKNNVLSLYTFLAAAVIILDRITKAYAITHFMQPKYITNFLTFELTYNRGISWGMFNSASDTVFLMVTFVIGCVTAMVAHMAWQRYKEGQWVIGELLVVAGSISNIIDRVLYRGVVDFILFHWNGWSWPLFNIADMAIVVGVSIMIWEQLKS